MESAQALRTLQKKRTSNFREDETKLLIELWGSPQIQNKLYLTHRKAPVMRIIAANMQQRGFYRTPDEIKTRIRNLKCLYHRIKRSVQSCSILGTVDPDWPHYKAMDDILSKQNVKKENRYQTNIFDGPRCEDIKQEIDDIEINDDMESYTTNSLHGSDYEEETSQMPILTPAPIPPIDKETKKEEKKLNQQHILPKPSTIPNVSIAIPKSTTNTTPNVALRSNQPASIPFPLLILNSALPAGSQNVQGNGKKDSQRLLPSPIPLKTTPFINNDSTQILKNILEVQKENLDVAKQRLELEKQKADFERLVGTQLLTLLPMFGSMLQRLAFNNGKLDNKNSGSSTNGNTSGKTGRKRSSSDAGFDILKDSKILRNVLQQGITKYMMGDHDMMEEDDSENEEDSGIQNDESSNASK